MASDGKLIPAIPLEGGSLVLRGRGCNPDVCIPVGAHVCAVDVLVTAGGMVRGVQVSELADVYDVAGEVVAGQFAVFLDGGKIVLASAGADAMRAISSRFN